MRCIYCQQDKPDDPLSLEHIFPQALGGDRPPDLFVTRRVCKRCNSLCGLFVDGPFIRNFFVKGADALEARRYLDPIKGSPLPLIFMGKPQDFPLGPNETMELWLGPCGDEIFHFHPLSESRYSAYAGGDPILAGRKPGEAYLFLATEEPFWARVALLSFRQHFGQAQRISCNLRLGGEGVHESYFDEPDERQKARIADLGAYLRSEQRMKQSRFSVDVGFEGRFLAKLALGIGHNLLEDRFTESRYGHLLQKALWEQDREKREALGFFHTDFFDDHQLRRFASWDGGHCISMVPAGTSLFLQLSVFGRAPMQVVLSDDPEIWKDSPVGSWGQVYVAVPQRDKWAGPIDLLAFIAHKNGTGVVSELKAIEALRTDSAKLPKCR